VKKIALFVALLLVVGSTPGWSLCGNLDQWIDEKAASEQYGTKLGGMLLQGIHRVIESPYEIFYHLYDGAKNEKPAATGWLKGLFTGIARAAENVMLGAVEIVSAAVPGQHGLTREHDHTLFEKEAETA